MTGRQDDSNPILSPVRRTTIGRPAERVLYARTAGRCEFDGCNRSLFENGLTRSIGNFGEKAHIVAFSEAGPRGADGPRPEDIDALGNIMLLCRICHAEIDQNPERYPRAVLEQYKRAHEDRIALVTSAAPDRKTTIVQLKARIGGKPVSIPAPDVFAAVAPMFPEDPNAYVVDVSAFDDRDPGFLPAAMRRIDEVLRPLHEEKLIGHPAKHISVFAFGPIPLLVYLGSRLSDKLAVDFFQFHRIPKTWKWNESTGHPAAFEVRERRSGTDPRNVALLMSVSGVVNLDRLPQSIGSSFHVFELAPRNMAPSLFVLNTREDLMGFRRGFLDALSLFERTNPDVDRIHLFPAIPLPCAVMTGHDLLTKAHPTIEVYDLDRNEGGYQHRLTLNNH